MMLPEKYVSELGWSFTETEKIGCSNNETTAPPYPASKKRQKRNTDKAVDAEIFDVDSDKYWEKNNAKDDEKYVEEGSVSG